MKHIRNFSEHLISENLRYHFENKLSITDNIFRPGSNSHYELLKECRNLFDQQKIELVGVDRIMFEETDLGRFEEFEGEIVPLDLPLYNYEPELNEAAVKGKKVKLNKPMRNTGSGKKYKVYVKNPKTGNIKTVYFGDLKGGLTSKIGDPDARRRFDQRHGCSAGRHNDKLKAGYWSCRLPQYASSLGLADVNARWW
jgi:hypothetical protein